MHERACRQAMDDFYMKKGGPPGTKHEPEEHPTLMLPPGVAPAPVFLAAPMQTHTPGARSVPAGNIFRDQPLQPPQQMGMSAGCSLAPRLSGIEEVEAQLKSLQDTRGVPSSVPPLEMTRMMPVAPLDQTQRIASPLSSSCLLSDLAASAAGSSKSFASAYGDALAQKSQAAYR